MKNNPFYTIGVLALCLVLAACSTTRPNVAPGFNLPPREQIIADPEPKPIIPAGASIDVIALEYAAAYVRANGRLEDGGKNYDNLRNTIARPAK